MEIPPIQEPATLHVSASVHGIEEDTVESGDPHEALFHALAYLRLPEVLTIRMVCRSLRDAVDGDVLLWRDVTVESSLSWKLTDPSLLKIASMAHGTLESLALIDCRNVKDAGLFQVAELNPNVTKLYVPGCTGLTPDGVVRVVERLSNLKHLKLYGLLNIKKEHLDSLNSLLLVNPQQPPLFYNDWHFSQSGMNDRPIDVDICPKCKDARIVFDCPRKQCQEKWLLPCRGCFFCIARCEECRGCIDFEGLGEETSCIHSLCSECWLQLPKCALCNKPSCSRHYSYLQSRSSDSSGFTCERCVLQSVKSSASTYMEVL